MENILKTIFSNERISSSDTFLIYPEEPNYVLTYNDLFNKALKIAHNLRTKNIKKGDRVLVFFENSPESVITAFALMIAGAVLIPVDPDIKQDSLSYIISNSKCKSIIAFSDNHCILRPDILNYKDLTDGETGVFTDFSVSPDSELVILYTSGTTGAPKGTVFTYDSIIKNFSEYGTKMRFSQSTKFLQVMPIFHADGWNFTILMPYLFNATVILTKKFDLKVCNSIFQIAPKYNCNVLIAIPSILNSILYFSERYDESELPSFDYVITSSEKLSKSSKESFESKFNCDIFDLYGLTETGVISYYNKDFKWLEGSVGKLQKGVKIKFNDEGEILVKSPFLFKEYCNNETLTTKTKTDGWFNTGDYGYISDDGYLYITERKDNVINKGGEKIIPGDIDNVIQELPFVEESFTLGIEDELYGQEIYSVVTLKNPDNIKEMTKKIESHCSGKLKKDMIPKQIIVIDSFPRNHVGKKDILNIKKRIQIHNGCKN